MLWITMTKAWLSIYELNDNHETYFLNHETKCMVIARIMINYKRNIPSFHLKRLMHLILVPWWTYAQQEDAANIWITDISIADKWPTSMTTYQACINWLLISDNKSLVHKWLTSMEINTDRKSHRSTKLLWLT